MIRLEATIRGTAERRLPASDAQQLYTETEDSRAEREQRVAEMKMTRPQGVDRNARPTKRERRQLERSKAAANDLRGCPLAGSRREAAAPARRTRNQWAA